MVFECVKGCGQCCGIIPFNISFWSSNKHLVNRDIRDKKIFGDKIVVISDDDPYSCIFLDLKSKNCRVYHNRPEVCRVYGSIPKLKCPIIRMDGTKRTNQEKRIIKSMIKDEVDFFLTLLKNET